MQAGCVDEQGSLWALAGSAGELAWPDGWEAQLQYMTTEGRMTYAGQLTGDGLFALQSLIAAAEDQGSKSTPWMNDAGTEKSYAVRYDREGNPEAILLGMTGDDVFENTDPSAQALYQKLRVLFPFVTCYAGMEENWGFSPVPVARFCGLDAEKLAQARVRAASIDCEEGAEDIALSYEEQREIIALALHGTVVGKENALTVTGGSTRYSFYDAEDGYLGSLELYRGLLVMSDGMYGIQ